MHQVELKVELREDKGKGSCKKIRSDGKVPGIIYGREFNNVMVQVDAQELRKTLTTSAGTRVIINMEVDGGKRKKKETYKTMVIEVQKDVFKKKYLHVDFHKISLDEVVHTEVPIVLTGESIGAKNGGVLDQLIWSIPVRALPLDIPEKIEVDITNLDENEHILVNDIKIDEKVKILADPSEPVVIVHPPKVLAVAEVAPEGEEAEAAAEDKSEAAAATVG